MHIRSAAFALLLLISGCAITLPVYDSDPEKFETVPETHGVVVLQIANLDIFGDTAPPWSVVRTSRIGGSTDWVKEGEQAPHKYHIYSDYEAVPGTSLWVGVLPAGNYLIDDFYAQFTNGFIAAPVRDIFASFAVEAGKTTVLGTYLYKGFTPNLLLTNVESRIDLVKKASDMYPEIMAAVDSSEPLYAMREARQMAEGVSEEILKWAETVHMATYGPDGRIYRPAMAGQLFERTIDGDWQRISLETFEPILSVFAGPRGEAVAVTQGGRVFRRHSAEDEFGEIFLSVEGRVRSVARRANGDWVAAVIKPRKFERAQGTYVEDVIEYDVELHSGAGVETTDWNRIGVLPFRKSAIRVFFQDDRVIVSSSGDGVYLVNLESGNSRRLRKSIFYLRGYGDGRMVALSKASGISWGNLLIGGVYGIASGPTPPDLLFSDDKGKTWQELPSMHAKGMPELLNDDTVLVAGVRTSRTREEQQFGKNPYEGFVSNRLGERHWGIVGKVPDECSGWLELKRFEDGLLVLCELNAFFKRDGRNEWKQEDMRSLKGND